MCHSAKRQLSIKSPPRYQPLATYLYFDRITLWLRRPLTRTMTDELIREHHKVENGVCWFDKRYRQKIMLFQPSPATLGQLAAWLDADDNVLVNYIELACDLVLREHRYASDLDLLFKRGFLQSWHGKMVPSSFDEGFTTRKIEPGENRAGRWFVWYADRHCKLTGETNCFHFEGRYQGVQFVRRRLGIWHPRDLLTFDLDAFFRHNMVLYEVNCERLGRFDHNQRLRTKRQKPEFKGSARHPYNADQARGESLFSALSAMPTGRSLQRFVDQYRRYGPFRCYVNFPFLRRVSFYVHVCETIMLTETIAISTLPSPKRASNPICVRD
jgi:hypothetical protein